MATNVGMDCYQRFKNQPKSSIKNQQRITADAGMRLGVSKKALNSFKSHFFS